jgi:multisubunit Na+/H+ antiporter MnhC subunit
MVMALDHAAALAHCAAAFVMFALGVVALFTAGGVGKRLMGLAVLGLSVVYALAALGAPPDLVLAAIIAAFCQTAFGVALMARIKEDYGSVEARDLDAADREGERADIA